MASAQIAWTQSLPSDNLNANGVADAGTASAHGRVMVGSIPGWTRTGNTNVLPYDLPGYVLLKDPAPPDHSFQYFFSGNVGAGGSTLTQSIDVSSSTSLISGGNVRFTASAYLGGVSGG